MLKYAQQDFYEENLVRFILEGAVELTISTWIAMASFKSHFNGQFWDGVSQLIAICFAITLVSLPLYIWFAAAKYNKATQKEAEEMGSGKIFSELKRKHVHALRFLVVFVLRRFALLTIIMVG